MTCATCGRDVIRSLAGGIETYRHAASWQVLQPHLVRPAAEPQRNAAPRPEPAR